MYTYGVGTYILAPIDLSLTAIHARSRERKTYSAFHFETSTQTHTRRGNSRFSKSNYQFQTACVFVCEKCIEEHISRLTPIFRPETVDHISKEISIKIRSTLSPNRWLVGKRRRFDSYKKSSSQPIEGNEDDGHKSRSSNFIYFPGRRECCPRSDDMKSWNREPGRCFASQERRRRGKKK